MALSTTTLDEWRTLVEDNNVDKWEDRFSNYGAYATYLKDSQNLIPGRQAMIDKRKSA